MLDLTYSAAGFVSTSAWGKALALRAENHPLWERVWGLANGSGPGVIATGPPGVTASGQVSEFEKGGVKLSHLAQINHEGILLENVLAIQELPGAVVVVMGNEPQFRFATKDAVEGDDFGALVVCEIPTRVHVELSGTRSPIAALALQESDHQENHNEPCDAKQHDIFARNPCQLQSPARGC